MIVFFGVARHSQPLGFEPLACGFCRGSSYAGYVRHYGVVHVFFLPMFTAREQVVATCEHCGREEVVSPPPRSASLPLLHRVGFLIPLAVLLAVGAASFVAEAERSRERARMSARDASASRRLAERLRSKEEHLRVGSVAGAGPIATRIAENVAPLLRDRLGLSDTTMGVYAVQVAAPAGESLLVLTGVADSASVDLEGLPSAAHALADLIATQAKDGTRVTWVIVHRGVHIAALGGHLGSRWFMQRDPILARALAEDALNYEGLIR